jgi:hypothetical protein
MGPGDHPAHVLGRFEESAAPSFLPLVTHTEGQQIPKEGPITPRLVQDRNPLLPSTSMDPWINQFAPM